MQDNVSITTNEKDLNVKYGMHNLCPEREFARISLKYILSDMNDIRKSFTRSAGRFSLDPLPDRSSLE